jgi:hypothetical protein
MHTSLVSCAGSDGILMKSLLMSQLIVGIVGVLQEYKALSYI